MNNSILQELKYDTTRGKVTTTRGEVLQVKEHRGWRYVNHQGCKVGLSKIPTAALPSEDPVFDYIFGGGSVTHPCSAMNYWIYRHRMGHRISVKDYEVRFNVKKRR